MKVQPSMSRSEVLLQCSFPFDRELGDHADVGDREAADYGSAFHELMAARLGPPRKAKTTTALAVATAWKLDDVAELDAHVKVSQACLADWLRNNPFGIDWSKSPTLVERALALRPLVSARYIAPANKFHVYEEAQDDEVPGTADLIILPAVTPSPYKRGAKRHEPTALVLDHKTGDHEDFSEPSSKAQLLSLAAAAMRVARVPRAIVAVLHSRRRGLPKVYADVVTLKDSERA